MIAEERLPSLRWGLLCLAMYYGWPAPTEGFADILRSDIKGEEAMQISILGIDLGKNSCSVVLRDPRCVSSN